VRWYRAISSGSPVTSVRRCVAIVRPRVAVSIETGRRNAMGLTEYLVIYGTARITEGGAAGLLQRLARTYLGPDVRFPPMDSPPPGYITHITVDRVSGVGPWAHS